MAGRKKPFSRFIALILALIVVIASGVAYYLIYLLNQDEINVKEIRKIAGIMGGVLLGLIILIVVFFIFGGAMVAKSLASLSGLLSILLILMIGVLMGLFFAILPKVKEDSTQEDLDRARLFAIIAATFGTFLFFIVIVKFVATFAKARKEVKVEKAGIENAKEAIAEAQATAESNEIVIENKLTSSEIESAKEAIESAIEKAKIE